jgi:alpha-D-ribose 1-methylphosphonate 5-triphosphate diphosphatase PhnM
MAVTQSIPSTRLTGTQTFNFTNTPPGAQWATVTINRGVNGGLDSLTPADTLEIHIDKSFDGGVTWFYQAGITCQGGQIVTKGVTLATDTLTVGIDSDDMGFRITTVASAAVRITGQVDYFP